MTAVTDNRIYLLASAIVLGTFILLFVSLGSQHHSTKTSTQKITPHQVQTIADSSAKAAVEPTAPTDDTNSDEQIEASASVTHNAVAEQRQDTAVVAAAPTTVPTDHAIIPNDHSGPPWALNLMSLSKTDNMADAVRDISAMGFTPEVTGVLIDGRHWYRIRIKGFQTLTAARQAGQPFINNKEYHTLWIGGY